jgi:hypothetical protein
MPTLAPIEVAQTAETTALATSPVNGPAPLRVARRFLDGWRQNVRNQKNRPLTAPAPSVATHPHRLQRPRRHRLRILRDQMPALSAPMT